MSIVCFLRRHWSVSEADGVGEQQTQGRAVWRGWSKLTMARPPDDDGTEAYIDEAAIRIQGTVNVMMTFITAT